MRRYNSPKYNLCVKLCTHCLQNKPLSDFNFKIKSKGILHSHCKNCSRTFIRNHYYNNRQYYLLKAKRRNEEIRTFLRRYLWNYLKKHACVDCGETDPVVLEFDHLKDKLIEVTRLVRNGPSIDKVRNEIEKCEIRCANCHRRKTAIQFGWYKNLPL
ncbi:MAG: hypothetical protein UU05_C0027G0006 [Candidatus Curtissbacteria bacterium GW2011_GWA1_40_47]|nr:MAG: hypothetical protein UT95_C0034G0002 [Candidatus Curtissbacteria bacterium GW2011_GWB1_40_28]KKR60713.1 MAG: hypothetical protein UU00_C0028G0006 [Microgenomates group bacterium GW2011_GWC1_40_35]KKR65153.1 MAG: hypothetical protein UU05_C0027G0006 [Candidatus Curtissbacteria bacterium GW2011_GWA1_40_47]KKS00645.1 MAG: hypothetical protein UU53_C0029G0009 [Candidatus Curtissbacteria bacterium GW2011_GWC2_41_21]